MGRRERCGPGILMSMRSPILPLVVAGVALAGTTGAALAQSSTFELTPEGDLVQVEAPAPGSDEAMLAEARRLLAEGEPGRARSLLSRWIERNQRSGSPALPEAYRLRGDAKLAAGEEFSALYDYELVAKQYSGTDQYVIVLERELEIANRYIRGLRRRFLGIRFINAADMGEELLVRIQERLPQSELAERAGMELADYYYRERRLELADTAYDLFLQNYPRSTQRAKAMRRRVFATLALFKGPKYDASPLTDARVLIERFSASYPADAREAGLDEALLSRIDESGARHMFNSAQFYIRRSDAVSAAYTLRRLVREHPRTAAASEAMELMLEKGWIDEASIAPLEAAEEAEAAEPSDATEADADAGEGADDTETEVAEDPS